MKLTKNSSILLLGLSLILSLVSFTGVVSHLPTETTQTTLVVSDCSEDKLFSITLENGTKDVLSPVLKYSIYSFSKFHNIYNSKDVTNFKSYTSKTLSLRAEQLHTKLYSNITHQILYNNIV